MDAEKISDCADFNVGRADECTEIFEKDAPDILVDKCVAEENYAGRAFKSVSIQRWPVLNLPWCCFVGLP